MNQSITDRIILFIEYKKLNIKEFETIIGISNGTLGKAIDRNGSINSTKLPIILEQFPELSADWLITGKGEMLRTTNGQEGKTENAEDAERLRETISQLKKELELKDKIISLLENK